MSITISQVQSLLSTYHRQQVQSRLSGARGERRSESGSKSGPGQDRVQISQEAKHAARARSGMSTEKVLKRIMNHPGREGEAAGADPEGESAAQGRVTTEE